MQRLYLKELKDVSLDYFTFLFSWKNPSGVFCGLFGDALFAFFFFSEKIGIAVTCS